MSAPNKPGLLIVFEGTDGTGKSTQLRLLASSLEAQDLPVLCTCEPTDGPYGRQIRALYHSRASLSLDEELELFLADRKEHVETLLTPGLQEGTIILCDRYYLSSIAYQGAAGLDPSIILDRNSFAPPPNLALLFHAPIEVGVQRITKGRGEPLNDFEKEDYLQRVAKQFAQLELPYIRRIDASRSVASVHQDVLHHVQLLLANR